MGAIYHVMDDESWKQKRNTQDHVHWLTYCKLWDYNRGQGLKSQSLSPGMIFEDKCIYCEAAEHEIPYQKIVDVYHKCIIVNHNQEEWIKQLEFLWLEYGGEAGGNVKPAKQ